MRIPETEVVSVSVQVSRDLKHVWNRLLGFISVLLFSLCVLLHLSLHPCSRNGETPISHFRCSPQRSLHAAYNVSRRCDSSWSEASSCSPPPTSLLSLSLSLRVHQSSVYVPGSLALTAWLESHSGTTAPGPKQGLMRKDTLSSSFSSQMGTASLSVVIFLPVYCRVCSLGVFSRGLFI